MKSIVNNLGIIIILVGLFIGGIVLGRGCGRAEKAEETLVVHTSVPLPKLRPIDSLGIFDKFKRRFPVPPVRYVEVHTVPGATLYDTVYVTYGMHFGITEFKFRSGIITFDWFTTRYDSAMDSTVTIIGHEPEIKLANPQNNYDVLPTGDPTAPFLTHEYKFSRATVREINLSLGGNWEKVVTKAVLKRYFFDKFFLAIDGRAEYYFVDYADRKWNNEAIGLVGIKF